MAPAVFFENKRRDNTAPILEIFDIEMLVSERWQSGWMQLPAKQLTWVTGSSGSNPDLSAISF